MLHITESLDIATHSNPQFEMINNKQLVEQSANNTKIMGSIPRDLIGY